MNYLALFIVKITFITVLIYTAVVPARVQSQELSHIALANLSLHNDTTWQHILPIPSTNDYLLVDQQGHFYQLIDGAIAQESFFSLTDISTNATALTAIVFHPNFSLRDQIGFHTFYTAHVEPLNTKRRYLRVEDTSATLNHDVIVTEWKTLNKTIDLESRREVMRIGVPSEQSHIKQLAFSPFTKSWNDDFGYLYLALNQDEAHQMLPLYSGAVLRIDPKKFGLRNYTVPTSNPFIKQDDIANELLVIGLQHIEQFTWPHKDNHSFLALHHYKQQQQLTLIQPNDDFRQTAPKKVLYKSDDLIAPNSLISYRGRKLAHLWSTSLFLKSNNGRWALHSLAMPNINDQNPVPTIQWQLQSSSSAPSSLTIMANEEDEVFVFDASTSLLNQLSIPDEKLSSHGADTQTSKPDNESTSFILYALLTIIGTTLFVLLAFFIRKKSLSARYIVNQQFSRLQISESKQHLALFKRHEKEAELELDVSNIVLCSLTLNKNSLLTISVEHPITNSKEVDVREKFNNERREKMMTGRLRQLNVELTDNNGHIYPICAYLRKGDNRITRKKFGEIIEEILDLCWLLSQNLVQTEQRSHVPVQVPEKKVLLKSVKHSQNKTKLATEEAPATVSTKEQTTGKLTDINQPSATPSTMNKNVGETEPSPNHEQFDTIDTNLVNALEKLAKLKEQGVLTEEEFAQAKQKVMIGLLK